MTPYSCLHTHDTLLVSSYATEGIVISTLGTHKWGGQKKTQLTFVDEEGMPFSMFHHNEGIYSSELYSYGEYILYEHNLLIMGLLNTKTLVLNGVVIKD